MLISARAGEEFMVRACHTRDLALAPSPSRWCKFFPLLWKGRSVDLQADSVKRPRRDLQFSFLLWPVLAIILSNPSVRALDPRQSLAQLYHSSWTEKQGINGTVTALTQTADGYLWVGTTDGLLRFDGISFEHYQPEAGSLMANSVSALMAVPDGGLWVGYTRGGASFIRNGQITNYSDPDGFPVSRVRYFARDRTGAIWAAAVGGFARLAGRQWQMKYKQWDFPGEIAWNLLVDREGTLWVAAGNQIVFLLEGEKQFRRTGIQTGEVSVITEAPDGAILFFDKRSQKLRGFRRGRGKKIVMLPVIDIAAKAAMFDRDGALWVGSNGLTRVPFPTEARKPHKPADSLNAGQGLSNETVEAIFEDREGNVWVGTDGGLDRFRHRNVTWFPLRGGPFSLVAGFGGDVWAGSRGAFPLVRVQDSKPAVGGPTEVYTAYRDPDGTVWFSANNSLLHWENGRFFKQALPTQVEQLNLASTPPEQIIASAITKDHSGNLWVAFGGSGEFRLSQGVWSFVQILPDHPDWSAGYSFTDSAGRIWMYWGDRIAQYDYGITRIFDAKEGLAIGPPDSIAECDQVLWVGGESGLAFLQNGRFHTLQSAAVSPFASVTGIVVTRDSGIWLSTGDGVVHIPDGEIKRVLKHPEYNVTFELFDLLSDLPEPIQRGEVYTPGAIEATDGNVWFPTRNGAVRVNPRRIYKNPLPPPVSIRSVFADEKVYSAFSDPAFPALTNNLRIEYAALSLSIPERVRFRYKLESWDKDWHEAGGRREAFFTHLPPGQYVFRVIACNNDGVWNETGATLNFTVAPAWFQTSWFRAVCVCAFLLLIWALYQLRLRRLKRQFQVVLEARLDERTRIARDLHDTLLQSFQGLTLHFQRARNLLPGRTAEAIQTLDTALDGAEQAIVEGRDAIHDLRSPTTAPNALEQELRALGEDLVAKTTDNKEPVEFRIVIEGSPRALSPNLHTEIFRIAREALRNAFNHSQGRLIEAELAYTWNLFRLRIRDNGKGIDPAERREAERTGHWGLRGMRERVEHLGGELEIWSEVDSGTELEVTVPAESAYGSQLVSPRSLFSRIWRS
jgi:signal transduction histidine kinase/ligand-binding sensor domain-containing protein